MLDAPRAGQPLEVFGIGEPPRLILIRRIAERDLGKLSTHEFRYAPPAGPEWETMRHELERFRALACERHASDRFRRRTHGNRQPLQVYGKGAPIETGGDNL